MKQKTFFIALLFTLLFIGHNSSSAQDSAKRKMYQTTPDLFAGQNGFRTWSFGLHGGVMAAFAASGGKNDFSNWVPEMGYGAYVKYQASHAIGLQLDFLRGKLKGNNDKLWAGLPPISDYKSFETNLNWATSLSAVFTLGNITWSQKNSSIQPYISLGGGAVNFNPTIIDKNGISINYKPDGSLTEFYVPFGLGIRTNISKNVNLDLGYTMAYVDADNLDGYLKSPYIGDKFSYAHIGLEFALGNKKKPQLATHNAPAQMYHQQKLRNDAIKAELYASEQQNKLRQTEINNLHNDLNRMKMDSDGDGVSDYFDKCPNTIAGAKVDGAGCDLPIVKIIKDTMVQNNTYIITEEDQNIVKEAIRNLEFDFGKATIRARSLPYLNNVADLLIKKKFSLKLSGHTDNIGSDSYNMKLSNLRANSIKDYLVSKGAMKLHIEAIGYGETQPIATNKTNEGRQKNRRVAFVLY